MVRYLDDPLDAGALHAIVTGLDEPASALVRRDAHFHELGIDPATLDDDDRVVALLVEHPRLLQRPIAVRDARAVIGRPPDRLDDLLGAEGAAPRR